MEKKCSVQNCDDEVKALGYCSKHYSRVRKADLKGYEGDDPWNYLERAESNALTKTIDQRWENWMKIINEIAEEYRNSSRYKTYKKMMAEIGWDNDWSRATTLKMQEKLQPQLDAIYQHLMKEFPLFTLEKDEEL